MDSCVYYETVSEVFDTWESVKRIENYEERVGVALFNRMFDVAPDDCSIFPWTKEHFQKKDPKFLAFATKFIRMIDMAVDMLGPDMDIVEEQMYGLGVAHKRYGVTPKHFDIMGKALEHTFQGILGNKFTPSNKKAWKSVYSFMSSTMIQGAAGI